MYDGGKIVTGLVLFIGFVTYPIWHSVGRANAIPELKKPVLEKKCIEPATSMRASHMQILDDWRNTVVRDGERTLVEVGGKKYDKSLQNSCMKCHTSKKEFCDKCHTYAGVNPYCWTCHVQPEEPKEIK